MDDIVKAALAKWPNVPACYGWLGLDARGQWWMRDDRVQLLGSFQDGCAKSAAAIKGSRLQHDKLIAFIERNYGIDAQGYAWFQNGPQRVYVELQAAPYIWRVDEHAALSSPMLEAVGAPLATVVDELGHLYLQTPQGFGIVHSQDMLHAANALERGAWPQPTEINSSVLAQQFAFVRSPQSTAEKA